MDYNKWIENWRNTLTSIKEVNGDVRELVVKGKGSLSEIESVENKLGFLLPSSFRAVIRDFSSEVNMCWFFTQNYELPGDMKSIFSGECSWSLDKLVEINEIKDDWVKECFNNKEDEYDKVWHNKLAFLEVGNGDFITIDLSEDGREEIVYLSHEGDDSNGMILGENFTSYIENLSKIGCCGPEDWQLEPFIENKSKGLDSFSKNAENLRQILKIDIS